MVRSADVIRPLNFTFMRLNVLALFPPSRVMRGVAVLAVVLFHAFPGAFGSGFLGVDVFFVVSGFLITGIILRGLERGEFSFKAFYVRRAKRLLPASLTTLAVTTALATVFLTRSQMADYAEQLLGSLGSALRRSPSRPSPCRRWG